MDRASKIFQDEELWHKVLYFISPNINELKIISDYFQITTPSEKIKNNLQAVTEVAEKLAERIPVIITTLGAKGVLVRVKYLNLFSFVQNFTQVY